MDQSGLVQHRSGFALRPFLIRSASHQFKGGSQELEASAEADTKPGWGRAQLPPISPFPAHSPPPQRLDLSKLGQAEGAVDLNEICILQLRPPEVAAPPPPWSV